MLACARPISEELLLAYWAGDLEEAESAGVEEHLFSCASCTASCARLARVTEAIRELIPVTVSREEVAGLRARGLRVVENPVEASRRVACVFPEDADVVLHVLRGLDLSRAEEVRLTILDEDSGHAIVPALNARFDRGKGEVLIACQKHYAAFPPNIVFEVSAIEASGAARTTRFAVPHVFG